MITSATTVALTWQGLLAGPDITGGDTPVAETVLLALVGATPGWWLARRGSRAASP